MKLLFLDDSYQKESKYLGYGGFCIDQAEVRGLAEDVYKLKMFFKIPESVEIKWSPPKDHFLRTKFKGKREDLYRKAIHLLQKHKTRIMCAVHSLDECYPISLHNWKKKEAFLWAAKEQLTYLAERFESIYLEAANDNGLIISDEYGQKEGEESIICNFSTDMIVGTKYHQLQRICMIPLMSLSKYTPHLQLADVVIGTVVSSLSGSPYGKVLFEDIAKIFVTNPNKGATSFGSTFSYAVLGYGLKLFPKKFQRTNKLFEELGLDGKYLVTEKGLQIKEEILKDNTEPWND
jgi:hypothetical protein